MLIWTTKEMLEKLSLLTQQKHSLVTKLKHGKIAQLSCEGRRGWRQLTIWQADLVAVVVSFSSFPNSRGPERDKKWQKENCEILTFPRMIF